MVNEKYLAEETREERMQQEFEEWGADDFSFPWLDCISTNQFSKIMTMPEFWKAIEEYNKGKTSVIIAPV